MTAEVDPAAPSADLDAPRSRTAWIRAVRPRQWLKNLLVLGAPLAAGRLTEPDVLLGAMVALGVFCLAASGCYLFNDVRDVEGDRLHPRKRNRPVASGQVSVAGALVVSLVLTGLSIGLALWWSLPLGLTVLAYLGVQAAYTSGLKHQPALDLAAVSAGFLLRAVAGGTATGITLSPWFVLVAAFGSLFMVAGKRYSEIRNLGGATGTRRSLELYSESYLRFIWTMAAGITITVYLLWALDGSNAPAAGHDWAPLSVAPFVLGLLRYAADVDRGRAEAPEDIVVSDRHLQVLGAIWVSTLMLHATLG